MDPIPHPSEVLYVGLCRKIGTSTEVAIRRDVKDMDEMITKAVNNHRGSVVMRSGSYRDGFRLRSSDRDTMFWSSLSVLQNGRVQSTAESDSQINLRTSSVTGRYVETLHITYLSKERMSQDFIMYEFYKVDRLRLGNRSQCLQSLTDLQTLLLYDDGTYVPFELRDIHWQILGICQHAVGDLQEALKSFEESLKQELYHGIQEATNIRKRWVKGQLYGNI
ncbi:uncharacterized protein LOC134252579 [Saccostrea cucullata]|uniref:uncharacterized protein LOC134252579 n=1 Tax=Saccostrea cuccullata TaxID=36930 RepID=UPI002ED4BD4F